jgi:hypothetical protein
VGDDTRGWHAAHFDPSSQDRFGCSPVLPAGPVAFGGKMTAFGGLPDAGLLIAVAVLMVFGASSWQPYRSVATSHATGSTGKARR